MTSAESADSPRRPQRPGASGDSAGEQTPRPRRRRRRGGRGRAQLKAVTENTGDSTGGQATSSSGGQDAAGRATDAGTPPNGSPEASAPKAPAKKQGDGARNRPQAKNAGPKQAGKQKRPAPAGKPRPDARIRTVRETSAGGLVVAGLDEGEDALRAALIGRVDRRGRTLWSLPKGHIEHGETAELTAIREIAEETGITGAVLAPIGKIDYWFAVEGRRVHKTVHHFLLSWESGELSAEDYEVSEVAWVPLAELPTRLTYSDERKLVAAATATILDLAADPDQLAQRIAQSPRTEPTAYEKAAAERNAVRNDPPKPRRRRGGRRTRGKRGSGGGAGGGGQT